MTGKTFSIRLNGEGQARLQNLKDNGYSLMDAVRKGLEELTDKSRAITKEKEQEKEIKVKTIKIIKTKEEAEAVVSVIPKAVDSFSTNGCGCLKEKPYLCEKHGRI